MNTNLPDQKHFFLLVGCGLAILLILQSRQVLEQAINTLSDAGSDLMKKKFFFPLLIMGALGTYLAYYLFKVNAYNIEVSLVTVLGFPAKAKLTYMLIFVLPVQLFAKTKDCFVYVAIDNTKSYDSRNAGIDNLIDNFPAMAKCKVKVVVFDTDITETPMPAIPEIVETDLYTYGKNETAFKKTKNILEQIKNREKKTGTSLDMVIIRAGE